jgi:hypothetical protein
VGGVRVGVVIGQAPPDGPNDLGVGLGGGVVVKINQHSLIILDFVFFKTKLRKRREKDKIKWTICGSVIA